jgi:hypothetical protein
MVLDARAADLDTFRRQGGIALTKSPIVRIALAVAAVLAACPSMAQKPKHPTPAAGDQVELTGCVEVGVEANCKILKSGGRTFNVSGLGLNPGDYAHGTAKVVDRMSYCMQGISVADYKPDSRPAKSCSAQGRASATLAPSSH